MTWRDHIKVHPAADLFPLMSEAELRELADDIQKNGLRHPVMVWDEPVLDANGYIAFAADGFHHAKITWLLDGRNRLDAIELAGFNPIKNGELDESLGLPSELYYPNSVVENLSTDDPYEYVLSANIHRRHLNRAERAELITIIIARSPEKSDRRIAEAIGVDHKTVGRARARGEELGRIPQLKKTTGKDGKARKKPRRSPDDFAKDIAAKKATTQPEPEPVVTTAPVTEPVATGQVGSWRVSATDADGGTWSSGVRLATKEEASRYMTHHAAPNLGETVMVELRVIPSEDAPTPQVRIPRNKKGRFLNHLVFDHGYCGLLAWRRDGDEDDAGAEVSNDTAELDEGIPPFLRRTAVETPQ